MPNNSKDTNDKKIDIAIAKYQLSNNRNILESETQWSRSHSFLVFNTILITAITISYQKDVSLPLCFIIFLPLGGLASCYLWYSMNSRSFKWINHWITSTRKIEKEYLKDQRNDANLKNNELKELNPVLEGYEIYKKDNKWLNSERATNFLIGIIAVVYVIVLLNIIFSIEWVLTGPGNPSALYQPILV